MKRLAFLLVILLAVGAAQAGTLSAEDQTYYRGLSEDGALFGWCASVNPVAEGWEYYFDFYTSGGQNEGWGYWLGGFDTTGVQNYADATYVRDIWSYENFGRGTDFEMPAGVHVVEDYGTDGWSAYRTATPDGNGQPPGGWPDKMWIYNWSGAVGGMAPGLLMTWRIVLDEPVYDGDVWVSTSWWSTGLNVFNMPTGGSGVTGDFDDDGDVDADDVDDLCANMGGDPGTYDMDGDGDVDEDDMAFHVENYLEYDTNGDDIVDGQGTFRGDFNADGSVNGTDLSIMSGSFGVSAGFGGGNANCDAIVNGTDLSILSGVFGSVATAAVPEPLTMGLLSLGGVALLRRRK